MSLNLRVPPPLVAILFGTLAWFVERHFPAPGLLSDWSARWLFGVLLVTAITIDVSAIWAFRQAKTTVNPLSPERASAIVRSGPYRFSRNPMYLGMAMILTAWVCLLGQPVSLLLVFGFVAYLTLFQIKPEEAILKAKFGEDFTNYLTEVRRWI